MATVHNLPVNDLIAHEAEGVGCPCGPAVEDLITADGTTGRYVVHHSLDGRELDEPPGPLTP